VVEQHVDRAEDSAHSVGRPGDVRGHGHICLSEDRLVTGIAQFPGERLPPRGVAVDDADPRPLGREQPHRRLAAAARAAGDERRLACQSISHSRRITVGDRSGKVVAAAAHTSGVSLHDRGSRCFASDNYSGVHPEVLAAIADANGGHVVSYGDDEYTTRLREVVRGHFGAQAEVFPVFNGTGANVLALQALLPRWGAVVCTENAHIHTDENGAPERVGGLKLLTVGTPDGKLTPVGLDTQAWGFGDEHRAQPLAVSLTQSTEVGTVYTPAEVTTLSRHAHGLGMTVHMDGARLANAAASLDMPLRAFTTDAGVDVLSLGGTKNGVLGAEAVVVLNPGAAVGLPYLRKLNMQLASKMRFLSAQLVALFEGDLWLRSAQHANAMAARLAERVAALPGLTLTQVTQANGVFAVLPPEVADRVRESVRFYDWNAATGEVRWMCSFDTTEADVDELVAAVRAELAEVLVTS